MKKLVKKKTVGKISAYFISIFFISIFLGVGYAYLNSQLTINGQTTINKSSWDVHFENLINVEGSVSKSKATIEDNATLVNFDVSLENPGDFYEFTVDVVNKGTIDAMVSSIVNTGISEEQQKILTYTVTYLGNNEIKEKQLLKAGDTETIDVFVKYRDDVSADDLPDDDQILSVSLSLMYVQADSTATNYINPICKRATTLHTEVCNQTDSTYYCSGSGYKTGDVITYGNLGTQGVLTTGDAFDCDVNGDGVYDPTTERFYYVSGKDGDNNSDYATLIYYNNVSNGAPNNATGYAYNTDSSKYLGPETAIKQLPTIKQWSNISLSNTKRNITDQTGNIKVTDFSYEGYAARLLTVQEVNYACGITIGSYKTGELDSCQYLMENTRYTNGSLKNGYWCENPHSSDAYNAWRMNSSSRSVNNNTVSNTGYDCVRPAIEILKSKMAY